MDTLFNINATPEIASGVFPSTLPISAVFWQNGENVIFTPGKAQKLPGWISTGVGALVGAVGALAQEFTLGQTRLYIATASNWYVWDGTVLTGIGSGFTSKSWSLIPWETWLIGTNNVDVPQIWKNAGVAAALAGVPFTTAKIFKKLGPHLLAYNTSNGETFLEWSSANQPEEWTPAAANSAGNLRLRELDSGIVAVQNLRGLHAVYSQDTMMLIQWLNLNDGFGRRVALNGIGAIGKDAVVAVNSTNYGISRQGVWVTDGVTAEYIDANTAGDAVGTFLQDELDWSKGEEVVGWHDERHTMVRWEYPKLGGGRAGIGFNYKTAGWSLLPATGFDFAIERQVFDTPFGAQGNVVFDLNSGKTANGLPIFCFIRTKPLGLEDDEQEKIVGALRVYLDDFTDVTVKFGTQDDIDQAIVFQDKYVAAATIDINSFSTVGAETKTQGRFIIIEFASETINADWKLSGFKILGETNVASAK